MQITADIVVIGAGPAGAAAAIALRGSGRSVIVVDRDLPAGGVGETVAGSIAVPLAQLGLREELLAAGHEPAPELVTWWGRESEPEVRSSIFDPYGDGWHLDRRLFDHMLERAAIARGVRFLRPARVRRIDRDAMWRMAASVGGDAVELQAEWIIDATGRRAAVARAIGGRLRLYDRLVGIVALGPMRGGSATKATLIEPLERGWLYSANLPGGRAVIVYMTDADLVGRARERWREAVDRSAATRDRARGFVPEQIRIVSAATQRLDSFCGERWVAAGDAAFATDPFTGNGICRALEMGLAAAQAITRGALGGYASWCAAAFERYLAVRRDAYAIERRWPASPFWSRRSTRAVTQDN